MSTVDFAVITCVLSCLPSILVLNIALYLLLFVVYTPFNLVVLDLVGPVNRMFPVRLNKPQIVPSIIQNVLVPVVHLSQVSRSHAHTVSVDILRLALVLKHDVPTCC